jgi:hypothetical protein
MKSNEINFNNKNNTDDNYKSPLKKPKYHLIKDNADTNLQIKTKSEKAKKKERVGSANEQEIDFSKRDLEVQDYLTGNLNKILYNRNKLNIKSNKYNVIQILSIKDIKNVKTKLNKIPNNESFRISRNSKATPNESDKNIGFDIQNSLEKKSKMNLIFKNEFEKLPNINNFINQNEKEEDIEKNIDNIERKSKSQYSVDMDIISPKVSSSNGNNLENLTKKIPYIYNNNNKFEKQETLNNLSNLYKKEKEDSNENVNDSQKDNHLDYDKNEKKENLFIDNPNSFIKEKGKILYNLL